MFLKKLLLIFILLLQVFVLFSIDVIDIIRKLDANQNYSSIIYDAEMEITSMRKKVVKTYQVYALGELTYYAEFTNPDDIGTRYLRKNMQLYVFSEDMEEVLPITGHMLKESMMGSDLSYEDMVENPSTEKIYNSKIISESADAWVIELNVKKGASAPYPKKVITVDKNRFITTKEEWYSLSGIKLKEYNAIKIGHFGNRNYVTDFEIADILLKESKTVIKMNHIEFDRKLEDKYFTLKYLQR